MMTTSQGIPRAKFHAVALFIASVAVLLTSCTGSSSPPAMGTSNSAFYQVLNDTDYINDPRSQPPAAEQFSENAKVFDLAQVPAKQTAKLLSAQTLTTDFALYAPRRAAFSGLAKAAAASVPGSGIPGFKPTDVIPAACASVDAADLRQCLDDNNTGMAPESVHSSYHDSVSLSIMLGDGSGNTVVNNVLSSVNAHIDGTTRNAIQARLNNYIAAISAHAGMDLGNYGMYDLAGYYLHNVIVTDGGRADSDGDGVLEPHSTLIVELRKPLKYTRMPDSVLDSAIKKYNNGAIPEEAYEITLKAYIHLDHLASFRQNVLPLPAVAMTTEQQLAHSAQVLEADLINHAFDANIIKKVLISGGAALPWNCTEYSVGFQLSSDTIAKQYAPILAKAEAGGDTVAVEAIEEHVDAQTALLTGGSGVVDTVQKISGTGQVTVMYQVSRPGRTGKATTGGGYDYATVDSSGRRVAIYDPSSNSIVIARSESKVVSGINKQVAFTKAGACRNDTNDWAYWPSRYRTDRFGRGIQWIYTEFLIHNQVGDYKNIHWYQSAWKAGVQVAVKGGTFVLTTYLKLQSGAIAPNKGGELALYLVETGLPYYGNVLAHTDEKSLKIAGYSLSGLAVVAQILVEKPATSPTLLGKLSESIGNFVIGFIIDRTGQGLAQMVDVTAVGWQDFSDGSHHGCFEFD